MAGKGVLDLIREGANPDTLKVLSEFLAQRAELRGQQDELSERVTNLNTAIRNIMCCIDVKSFEGPEGTLVYKAPGSTKTLNKKLLITKLLDRGVDPTIVSECVEQATKETPSGATVSFYKADEKARENDS